MRALARVALSTLVVLLVTGGLVWAQGLARTGPVPPSVVPVRGPGQMHGTMPPMPQDPETVQSMLNACVQMMQDPQMQWHMREHMSDPGMRHMMADMTRSMMPGMPMLPMMPGPLW